MAKALGGNVSFGFESGRARSVCKAVSSGAHGPGRKILVHGNPVKTHESGTMLPVVVNPHRRGRSVTYVGGGTGCGGAPVRGRALCWVVMKVSLSLSLS
jgi:hypothetical protein